MKQVMILNVRRSTAKRRNQGRVSKRLVKETTLCPQ
jgi:hypothetical protein